MKRYFRLVKLDEYFGILNNVYGRYIGRTPHQAACKAFRRLVADKKKENSEDNKHVCFCIKECTHGSKKRLHWYQGHRISYAHPYTIMIREKRAVYNPSFNEIITEKYITYTCKYVVQRIMRPQIRFINKN